jgi:hypothetical protein
MTSVAGVIRPFCFGVALRRNNRLGIVYFTMFYVCHSRNIITFCVGVAVVFMTYRGPTFNQLNRGRVARSEKSHANEQAQNEAFFGHKHNEVSLPFLLLLMCFSVLVNTELKRLKERF